MSKKQLVVTGLLDIAQGVVLVATLGNVNPSWTLRYAFRCAKRQANATKR